MEKFQESLEKAKRYHLIADHMLTQTYPLIEDPKLLMSVMENVFLAYANGMAALLYYDRLFKHIPPFNQDFDSKLFIFEQECLPRYKLSRNYLHQLREIRDAVLAHRKSPVEFRRKDVFVICTDAYDMQTITMDRIKTYLNKAALFLRDISSITTKNAGIFR
ncbi:hypothetical protein HZB01_02625 [Candidatus Woesearchaeota archaeon]|nr:hypothetical protein [Candidatus Woesearchaeota archaeon]